MELFQTQCITRRNTSHLRYKYQSTKNSEDVTRINTHINSMGSRRNVKLLYHNLKVVSISLAQTHTHTPGGVGVVNRYG
jgi:hypothetical protein